MRRSDDTRVTARSTVTADGEVLTEYVVGAVGYGSIDAARAALTNR